MRTARVSLPGIAGIVEAEVLDGGERLRAGGPTFAATRARFEPAGTGLVYGVILNDGATLAALASALDRAPYNAAPKAPVLYIKPWNTHAGHGASVTLPAGATEVEVLGTLAVVIGTQATRLAEGEALSCVRGYTVAADLGLPQASYYRPPIREKCFDGSCPLGPWVVARELVPEPSALEVRVSVGGTLRQQRSLRDLVRPLPRLIADVTAFLTLYPGDVLLVGVPHEGPRARAGDTVAVEIAGVGTLACRIVEGAA
jgi:5-oxopent-3-ene-1,2,5-tricarboxylate decarboxylase/2-hydroxyhepta-2,4-diene-1,7-dioate isomerase